MKDPLTRLTERTGTLGNYNRKYIHIVSEIIEKLEAALEQHGTHDRVHLWNYSMDIAGEMDIVLEAANDDKEKLDFLGCYFALQFLHMNLRMVDIVKLELTSASQRWQTGRRMMLEAGRMFRFLTKSYMERLLKIFVNDNEVPEFVMIGVGTRADQDDIDLALIHEGSSDPINLNRAMSRLSSEMFRKSTRLHLHISEYVGDNSLTATIDQYAEFLDKGNYDFIIVSEMLGAAVILGSQPLYDQFKARITDRFYYHKDRDNRFHEAYLRGILGEINSLLTRLKPKETINPKDDGLRPIKSTLSALKVVYGVEKVNAWYIIDQLKEKNPSRYTQYSDLEQSLSFFELFRQLYQIMVAQDEDINLGEPGIEDMVARIAKMMGFEKMGVVSAKDFMLVTYYDHLEKSISAIEVLTGDLKEHLRRVSIFRPIFLKDIYDQPGYKGNLAIDFVRASDFVKGITYWDDFQEELISDDNLFYNEFVDSFSQLPKRIQQKVAKGYVAGIKYDPASVLRFLVILGSKARTDNAKNMFDLVSKMFVENLYRLQGVAGALAQILYAYPGTLNSFLALIDWETLDRFVRLVRSRSAASEYTRVYNQLVALVNVHHESSHFFKWHFHQILNKYPLYIRNLHNNDKLREITSGFYSDLTSLASLEERIERLGDYYDLEFVRVSLLAMAGVECEQTDAEFIEFSDNYTHSLFEFCQQEVQRSLNYSLQTQDLFALYATGGHAREHGFDDDYDLIVILDSSDEEIIAYCNMIVGKMNSHILKRGLLPHHRFADHFDSYVVSFEQLGQYLSTNSEHLFVEQSQILSARMLVGSHKLERRFYEQIVEPYIFARGREYVQRMKAEMKSRRADHYPELKNDIKECPGGLRDIEMLLMMYETKYQVNDPLSRKFLHRLEDIEPQNAEKFRYLEQHLSFIKKLRDLYRLKVAAHNVLDCQYLLPVATSMGYGDGPDAVDKLYEVFLQRTAEAVSVIDTLMQDLEV